MCMYDVCFTDYVCLYHVCFIDYVHMYDVYFRHVTNDVGRFSAPEGLFQQHVWEMDNPALPKLIQAAILACPMDARRQMWR